MRVRIRIAQLQLLALATTLATAAAGAVGNGTSSCSGTGTQGLVGLVRRRIPAHAGDFEFCLLEGVGVNALANSSNASNASANAQFDAFVVTTPAEGRVRVEAGSVSGLVSGLHRYLADVVHVDVWWFVGSQLHLAPEELPRLNGSLTGASVVPWRYHFNTVTFSYTTAFWTWEDWELELDWLALRGVNLPLAWVGVEKILVDVFRETGLTDAEIQEFFSAPAFQSWNRLGNIQGSWTGPLPLAWIDEQFALQKRIVRRMVELGMTPVLPAFTGFVPRAITRVLPNATVVDGSQWNGFPVEYTNATFLEPTDAAFARLQQSFISKQQDAYGNISHIYTLDQYNENDPYSGDLGYLQNVTQHTWASLKAADPAAIWLMQGWLFYSNRDFWTEARIEAFLSGVPENSDMLILDLFSESQPQWQRTNSYFGKPWIWCQLHDYGGNMGLYGQVENITVNPIAALANSSSLVGFGLTMEAQEGNEVVYDLLLDQAWSPTPIDTEAYFAAWVRSRYSISINNTHDSAPAPLPPALFTAWDLLRRSVYNNTRFSARDGLANAVPKSILELRPALSGLTHREGHHPTARSYAPAALAAAWQQLYAAAAAAPALWDDTAFRHDLTDVSRQVLSNHFEALYQSFVASLNSTLAANTTSAPTANGTTLAEAGAALLRLLAALDALLATSPAFSLSTWLRAARASAPPTQLDQDAFTAAALLQLTQWGPHGEIGDYASKAWAGLVGGYYKGRWEVFVGYAVETVAGAGEAGGEGEGKGVWDPEVLAERERAFEEKWVRGVDERTGVEVGETRGELKEVLERLLVRGEWAAVFGGV
ncbi:glycoside hydrolase family 89 protein [Aplosporella prunicola CBS 121167]|uniref:Glycoside hydrolase family 89 protein n=1 Tax=Aplosporella prunicola CBS 121167 TaxID=1176127 RepID=A0A6A6BBR2_9PEZI|nr:glycoside hydrolase family 89 protein [Aplosporella prunicola CBS 121167]KAF2141486.1 glycoside hydrolase family 89 protein [Aplosporella prunicola CBS 121167]